ncbi:hypothetical protein OSH11_14585 [Kaistia dalseonensis]|uniref:Uncharacterized protein n=1 Tax=Kaistia dalseonensis TaxID=410840 RepID=A0ABU0H8D6_9HYPH|nr:hypothetical protein [Kaistia dalseonensis]MCX5495937.1 hypothetical protein [Kaistia dalseonensis]MDQ0438540.1 hypothetical protein [Kaistia dalseonensis]
MSDMNAESRALARFTAALDQYGPDMTRWPLADRRDGLVLLRSNVTAQRELAAAQSVGATLGLLTEPDPAFEARLRRNVFAALARPPAFTLSRWRIATISSLALAASLMVGFVTGVALPDPDESYLADTMFRTVQMADLGNADTGDQP